MAGRDLGKANGFGCLLWQLAVGCLDLDMLWWNHEFLQPEMFLLDSLDAIDPFTVYSVRTSGVPSLSMVASSDIGTNVGFVSHRTWCLCLWAQDFRLCMEYIGFFCLTMNLQLLVCAVTTWLVVTEDASKPQLRGAASSIDGTVPKEVDASQTPQPDIAVFSSPGIEKDHVSGYEQLQGQNATGTLNNTAGLTGSVFSELKSAWDGHPGSHGGPPPGARHHPSTWPGHDYRPHPPNRPPPVYGPRRWSNATCLLRSWPGQHSDV